MDRRTFVKETAFVGGGAIVGAVTLKCSEELFAPVTPPVTPVLAAVSLTQDAYKKWLRNFKPKQVVGTRGSEIDCPTARFASAHAGIKAIVLVEQHAFSGGPPIANPAWLREHVKKLDAAGPDGSSVTRLEAQKLL